MIEILSEGHSCLETPHHMAKKERLSQIINIKKPRYITYYLFQQISQNLKHLKNKYKKSSTQKGIKISFMSLDC